MAFADRPPTDVDSASIEQLITLAVPEGLRIGFKRELDVSSKEQKREAGKDASAMANTTGGRILYGIDEATLPDGSKVASRIIPITNGAAADQLADVLTSIVTPRPQFNM